MPKYPSRKSICIGLVTFFIGAFSFTILQVSFHYTNRLEYCVSCHSMQINYQEYKESLHYKNTSGVRATCADCHVPKSFFPMLFAKTMAIKDFYHEVVGTIDSVEKFEARRWEMANVVWEKMRANDSQQCRDCHDYANMDLSEQTKQGRKKHTRATQNGKTCIDCHAGVAHEEPLEPETHDVSTTDSEQSQMLEDTNSQ